jgi:UDP-GlcNAc:undecaprenyl-phosphate GlcNAc-1-phosphate transferase
MIAISAFLLSVALTFLIRSFFLKLNILDFPDSDRKKHQNPVPFGGGIPIILTSLIFIWLIEIKTSFFTSGLITRSQLTGLTLASFVIAIIGFIDDKYQLSPKFSVLGPLIASIVAVFSGFSVAKITNPFGGALIIDQGLSFLIVFIWLLLLMFSMKFLDGVDGLSSGTASVATLFIFLLATSQKFFQPDVALMSLIIFGACLGFFTVHISKFKIYLGEIGSVWLGFILAILSIISGSKLMTILLVMALPVIDAIFVTLRRLRLGKSIFKGDRLHLHHLLIDAGWSKYAVLGLYLATASVLGLSSLILNSWQKLLLFFIVIIVILFDFFIKYGKKI